MIPYRKVHTVERAPVNDLHAPAAAAAASMFDERGGDDSVRQRASVHRHTARAETNRQLARAVFVPHARGLNSSIFSSTLALLSLSP